MPVVAPEWLYEINQLRHEFAKGDHVSQKQLDEFCRAWATRKHILRPREKDEMFHLVDALGQPNNLVAPRWASHLLGLRHRCGHIALRWTHPSLGKVFVLQVRHWTVASSPGHVDLSVGGHILGADWPQSQEAVLAEMMGELGLTPTALEGGRLLYRTGYEIFETQEDANYVNCEWREVYTADLTAEGFSQVRFNDGEVASLLLCPETEAQSLLNQQVLPIASALRHSLPYCLS